MPCKEKMAYSYLQKLLPIIPIPAITNEILMTFFEPTLSEIIPPTKLKKNCYNHRRRK